MNIPYQVRQLFSRYLSRARSSFGRRSQAYPLMPSHMESLPNELTAYIFALAVEDDTTQSTLIIISHVNSRWREISLSNGSLWAQITMTFPIASTQLSRITASLARSGTYPLIFLLDLRDPNWDWQEETHKFRWQDMEVILRILLVHVSRWKIFELLTDTWAPIFTFLWYTEKVESAPMLESLHLSRCNAYVASRGQVFQPASLKLPKKLFGNIELPSLRDVSLVGVHVIWAESSLRHLTSLELKYHASDVMPSVSEFRDIFLANSGLLKLSIVGWGPIILSDDPGNISPPRSLELPALHHLHFGIIDIDYAKSLLSLFHFPSLKVLTLEDVAKTVNPEEPQDSTALLQWLANSHDGLGAPFPVDRIRILEFHGINCDPLVFTQFLAQFSSLNNLQFYDMSEEYLLSLRPQPPAVSNQLIGSVPCPELTELHCQDVNLEALTNILRSRSSSGSALPIIKVFVEYVQDSVPSLNSSLNNRLVNFDIRFFRRQSSSSDFEE